MDDLKNELVDLTCIGKEYWSITGFDPKSSAHHQEVTCKLTQQIVRLQLIDAKFKILPFTSETKVSEFKSKVTLEELGFAKTQDLDERNILIMYNGEALDDTLTMSQLEYQVKTKILPGFTF